MSNSVIRKLQLRKQNEGIWAKKNIVAIMFCFSISSPYYLKCQLTLTVMLVTIIYVKLD